MASTSSSSSPPGNAPGGSGDPRTGDRPAGARPRPGLGTVALIGALTWVFALGIGPRLVPAPAPDPAAAVEFEDSLDPRANVLALTVPDGMLEGRPRPVTRTVEVGRGDTLMRVLTGAGVARREAHAAIEALRAVYDPRDLRPGHRLRVTFQPLTRAADAPASFRGLAFKPDVTRTVAVERTWDNRFAAREDKARLTRAQARAEGVIDTSLYVDAIEAGVPPAVVVEAIRAFSFSVDFQRDIHPDDRFEILYDRLVDPRGRLARAGDVIFAALTLRGERYPLYRHRLKDGTVDYFNAKGESVRKLLMRTPVDGARLSSGFGRRRHPILGYTKVHTGIDFAAPAGTPIMAAGRGVIASAGRNGGYGNYVRIRHNATYATAYAHLSRFARGIRRGQRVRQGQVIGYVGSTGRSTGPHLHYEVLRNNRHVNPRSLKLPTGRKLKGAALERFLAARAEIDRAYASLPPQPATRTARSRAPENGAAHDDPHGAAPLGTGGP